MASLVLDLVTAAIENEYSTRVVRTLETEQVVINSLEPNDEIGKKEYAPGSHVFVVASGEGIATVDGVSFQISPGVAVIVKSPTPYTIKNTSDHKLKLYGIHSPPILPSSKSKKIDDLPGCACDI